MNKKNDYSTREISPKLMNDISDMLRGLDYGSVELHVVNEEVTQISKRHIKKTNGVLKPQI